MRSSWCSFAVAPNANLLATTTALRAITLVTCGFDLAGQRERTLGAFVAQEARRILVVIPLLAGLWARRGRINGVRSAKDAK